MEGAVFVFVEKAEENMGVATDCFDNEHYNACVNRAYYGMFQIAVALLFKSGCRPKSNRIGHGWVQAEFTRLFINQRKRFPRLKGCLSYAQETRDYADYSEVRINRKKAKQVLAKANNFFRELYRELYDED